MLKMLTQASPQPRCSMMTIGVACDAEELSVDWADLWGFREFPEVALFTLAFDG